MLELVLVSVEVKVAVPDPVAPNTVNPPAVAVGELNELGVADPPTSVRLLEILSLSPGPSGGQGSVAEIFELEPAMYKGELNHDTGLQTSVCGGLRLAVICIFEIIIPVRSQPDLK